MVVAYILATSRWGSQFGVPPLYICDALLALTAAHYLTQGWTDQPTPPAQRDGPGIVAVLLLAYAVVHLAASAPLDLTTLRDAVPYLYVLVAFLAAASYRTSTPEQRRGTLRLFNYALLFHLAWVSVARFIPSLNTQVAVEADTPAVALFRIRTDFDSAVIGITVAWYLLRLMRGDLQSRVVGWAVVLGGAALVLSLNSRAGLIAMCLCVILVLLFFLWGPFESSRLLMVLGVAPLALVVVVALLPLTPAGAKLVGGFGLTQEASAQPLGVGTQQARAESWAQVVDYTQADPGREVVGVGFGENFMTDSGAIVPLVGYYADDVRSPHNWFVGTFARLGWIGVGLIALLLGTLFGQVRRLRRRIATDDLAALAALSLTALIVAATLGVIMESPFGAIPFFWFAGVLLCKPTLDEPVRLSRTRKQRTPERPGVARKRALPQTAGSRPGTLG